ncbi:hypothetical protein LDT72_000751 [Salmonella enterica]|nr:hypothetical protein [Salmonella enterica]EIE7934804.1 hypothetical protein [Salmonella enterica]
MKFDLIDPELVELLDLVRDRHVKILMHSRFFEFSFSPLYDSDDIIYISFFRSLIEPFDILIFRNDISVHNLITVSDFKEFLSNLSFCYLGSHSDSERGVSYV